jgi:transcriptional regulator with XRE-family HTH domain
VTIDIPRLTAAMAVIIDEARKARGITSEDLAKLTGITHGTIRNIGRKRVEVKARELVAIAAALSSRPLQGSGGAVSPVSAAELLDLAIARAGGLDALMSAEATTKDDLETRRLQKEAAGMSLAEIEGSAIAATTDAERRVDEPPAP